jgi:hypothetical protein
MWYEDDSPYREDYTIQRELNEEEEKRLLSAQFMEEIVDQIYGNIPFNLDNLERSIDELCYFFNIPSQKGDVQVRPIKEASNLFNFAIETIREQGKLRGLG